MAKTNIKIITGVTRLSYAHIWEPQKPFPGKEAEAPKYGVVFLIPKKDVKTEKAIRAGITVLETEYKAANKGKLPKGWEIPLKDGDEKAEEKDAPEYKDHWYVNAKSTDKPGVIDRDKNEILDKKEVYSGCYAIGSFTLFSYNFNNMSFGVGAALNNIMKVKDGEAFSGGASAEDDFADVEIDENDLDADDDMSSMM